MKKLLTTSLFASLLSLSVFATDYTIETIPEPATPVLSFVVPLVTSASSTYGFSSTSVTSSVTQQIFLASELKSLGASAGNIKGVKFYYGGKGNNTSVAAVTRSIKIYISPIAYDSLKLDTLGSELKRYRFSFKDPGTLVYDGTITTETITSGEVKELLIDFNKGVLAWDGSKNILLTVFDVTDERYSSDQQNFRFVLKSTSTSRFVHQYWVSGGSNKASDYLSTLTGLEGCTYYSGSGTAQQKQISGHHYVPKTTFTIVTPIPAPENLSASSITTSSARLSWDAVTGSTSYNVRWGTTSGSLSESAEGVTNTYLDIDELEDGTTYYFDVQTVTSEGTSAFASEVSFETTAITHEHNGITFSKWSSTTSMPLSGNYYLANDVEISSLSNVTLTGNLNLCLNGHTVLTSSNCIIVPDGVTFAIFDNEGSGVIRGAYPGEFANSGLISVKNGGTLKIGEGGIVNLADDANDYNLAIDNKGTLLLSGAPTISGVKIDIYLANNKVITINGALTNTTPYSVNSAGQVITSGWSANMGDANPSTHFTSAKSGYSGLTISEGEVKLVQAISLSQNDSEETFNSKISGKTGIAVNVSLDRTFTSASYNTLCLPFALSDAQLQSVFGSDYDLEEFTGSSVNGEELDLSFDKVTSLTAGQPYLIQPSEDVSDPTFTGVTISVTSPVDQTGDTYVSFHGVFAPTNLEANNRNLLFLGAANTLFWPNETAPINGFRAYFEIKGSAAQAAKRARIVNRTDEPTAIDQTAATAQPAKRLVNGQLLIDFNGKTYNAQGILIK